MEETLLKMDADSEKAAVSALKYLLMNIKDASQKKIAMFCKVSEPYISDIKNARKNGSPEVWQNIAGYFNMDIEEFINLGVKLNRQDQGQLVNLCVDISSSDEIPQNIKNQILEVLKRQPSKIDAIEGYLAGLLAGLPKQTTH